MMFVQFLNPLPFLLNKCKGYSFGRARKLQYTHNFFADDLKLYSQDLNSTKKQLDIIATFSRDINMQFGEEKCAYLQTEKGKKGNPKSQTDFHKQLNHQTNRRGR